MSTNNFNTDGFPDAEALEKLANEFFATKPGNAPESSNSPKQVSQATPIQDTLLKQGSVDDLTHLPSSLPDPHFPENGIPKSVAGSGISPSAFQGNTDTAASSGVPEITPSWFSDIFKQTGSISPTSPLDHLPYATEHSFETALGDALKSIHSSVPTAQLPKAEGLSFDTPAFYFLTGKEFQQPAKEASGFSTKTFSKEGVTSLARPPFDVALIRNDFPILQKYVNGRRLIWLDNAATTQKPNQVIDRVSYFYRHENSNIHRAAHDLAALATDAYEGARKKVQGFLNASSVNEIVFVRGATEAINLVAKSWGEQNLNKGDEIIVTHLEHHANIVPWQQLSAKKDLRLRVVPVDDDGQVILEEYAKLLSPKTKLVSFTQVSNALGTVTPAKTMVEMAHHVGAKVLVDGAQAVSHMRADVSFLDCDWYVFSGHKVFGPTGIGVLYGKEALLNETQPWQGGGNMIADVTFEHTRYQQAPSRFEAGTGNIADAVGLGAAIDYVTKIGMDAIHQYEHYLLLYATKLLKDIPGLRLIGTAPDKAGVLSFVLDGFRTEEVGSALNKEGIAVRSGHHCAQPILRRFGVESSVRPSLALYNTCADIDALVAALLRIRGGRA